MMKPKEEYFEWTPVRIADPRVATADQLIHGMELIVETEGPILASRVFHILARAGGLGRIYEPTRKRLLFALQTALQRRIFMSEKEIEGDPWSWVLRLPSQKAVRVRSLGARTLHEVPMVELAEVMLEVRVQNDLISKEELFRGVLEEYGLLRLTEATNARLDFVLRAWF